MGERMPVGVPVPGVVQAADAPAGQGLAGRKGEVALATQPRPGSGGAAGCPKRRHLGYVGDEPEPGGAGPPPGTAPPGSAQGVSQGRMRLPSLSSAICSHARARSERRSFLVHLVEQKVSYGLFNQVRCALVFFYRVTLGRDWSFDRIGCQKQPKRLPVVLSQAEIAQFFAAISRLKYRALFMAVYGCGLRVSEVVALRAQDIDSKQMVLRVCQGKGKKDRIVMLSPKLLEALREYYKAF